jgi:NAD(P)-dependent dehydrogenase (short-subunit alcohol dehydrogenase family)
MQRFPQKRVFITGAGSGFGKALALEFAQRGWKVGVSDIVEERVRKTAEEVRRKGGQALEFVCDVTNYEALEQAAERIQQEWKGLDIVVNNAGIAVVGLMEKVTVSDWDKVIDVDLKSVIYGCRIFIPMFKRQGHGHIVNMASAAGFVALPEMGPYNVAKAGVIGLSETLRPELAKHNIGVTVLMPTFFRTNLTNEGIAPEERNLKWGQKMVNEAKYTSEQVVKKTMTAIEKNCFYVVPQFDGRQFWFLKRHTPNVYSKLVGFMYNHGLDKFKGLNP